MLPHALGEQVVGQLQPRLERGQRRRRVQALALGDQLAGAQDELVAGHAPSLGPATRQAAGRLGPCPPRRPTTSPGSTSPAELRDWLEANHETATERWVGMRPKASGLPDGELGADRRRGAVRRLDRRRPVQDRRRLVHPDHAPPDRLGVERAERRAGARRSAPRAGCGPAARRRSRRRRDDLTAIYAFEQSGDARPRHPGGPQVGGRARLVRGAAEVVPPARRRVDRDREARRDEGEAPRGRRGRGKRPAPGVRAAARTPTRGLIPVASPWPATRMARRHLVRVA